MRQLGEATWVLEGPTNIGFIQQDGNVILIDSGNDKEAGRRINKILKEKNWNLQAIINTHSNADHIGGNDYLQRNLKCDIYASEIEDAFIGYPELETAFLWGGRVIKDLRNKFFRAKASSVTKILQEDQEIGTGIKTIGLGGHFLNMIGVETPDRILFLGDSLFGENILRKYRIPFIYDVGQFKETIREIKRRPATFYIPSHGPVEERIEETADANLKLVERIEDTLREILTEGKSFDDILKEICDIFLIRLDAGQYALVGSTIKSFLTYLHDKEEIGFDFRDNRMIWKV